MAKMVRTVVIITGVIVIAVLLFLVLDLVYRTGDTPIYRSVSLCDATARTIIEKYDIELIHSCESLKFNTNGTTVYFVKISYGPAGDCPAGCIYNHFWTIVEGKNDYPYTLELLTPDDQVNILNLTQKEWFYSCSEALGLCSDKLPGRKHWLVDAPEFESIRQEYNR